MWAANDLLTGLRIGAIVLWAWLALRVLFESWEITEQTVEIRRKGWAYWRASLLTMSFAVVFFFSPENILRANGYIDAATGFWMMAAGVACLHACAILDHMGLDIATGGKNKALPAYLSMSVVSVVYGITAGVI